MQRPNKQHDRVLNYILQNLYPNYSNGYRHDDEENTAEIRLAGGCLEVNMNGDHLTDREYATIVKLNHERVIRDKRKVR